jgi:hypothetical protein
MKFNINKSIVSINQLKGQRASLVASYLQIEKLLKRNAIQKLIRKKNLQQLNIILGEATQNIDNFIYGENDLKLSKNSFLTPSVVLGRPCGQDSGFVCSHLHDFLADRGVLVTDLYPLPLPSSYYNSKGYKPLLKNLNGQQELYLDKKTDDLLSLMKQLKTIKTIRCITRYKKSAIKKQAVDFVERLEKKCSKFGVAVEFDSTRDLSNRAGGLCKTKFDEFISIL